MQSDPDIRHIRTKILIESQAVFGERFGVDQSTVARWEKDGLPSRGVARMAIEKFAAELERAS